MAVRVSFEMALLQVSAMLERDPGFVAISHDFEKTRIEVIARATIAGMPTSHGGWPVVARTVESVRMYR